MIRPSRPPMHRSRWFRGLAGLVAVWLGLVLINVMQNPPPLGTTGGRLPACPPSPNCVCSQDADAPGHIAPLACPGPATATAELARLREIVLARPRTRLLEEHRGYLRFEVTTALMRFRDDLEFLADDAEKVIHVRSSSRVGHSDLGTNRRRVEEIRALFASIDSSSRR